MLSLVKICVLICKMLCGSGWSVLDRQEENTDSFTLSKIDSSQRRPFPKFVSPAIYWKMVAYSGGICSPLQGQLFTGITVLPLAQVSISDHLFLLYLCPLCGLMFQSRRSSSLIFNADMCCGAWCAAVSPYNRMLPQGLLRHSADKVSGKEVC